MQQKKIMYELLDRTSRVAS